MLFHGCRRFAGLMLTACATLVLSTACGAGHAGENRSGTFFGQSQSIGNGQVRTYATLDNAGNPAEVGVRISAASLDGLPAEDAVPPQMLMLEFPQQASTTVFDHVMMNWNSEAYSAILIDS